jgi:AcrR family transcriptional regulator
MTDKPRRSQRERRESTIQKLLDAATQSLIEVGYSGTSVQVVCSRANVSQGALFRHFETREALMVAVGTDIGRQTLVRYRKDFESLRHDRDPLVSAMELLRDRCASRLNQAWYELAMAARTSPSLKKGLRSVATAYYSDIEALARELLPDLAAAVGDSFGSMVRTIVAVFDGEMVQRFYLGKAAADPARIPLLASLLSAQR